MVAEAPEATAAAPADTADAGPLTPPPGGDTPPAPETERPADTGNGTAAAPETPAQETDATDTPDWKALLEQVPDEELEQHPKFRDTIARREESARRKAEVQAAEKVSRDRQQWIERGAYETDLQSVVSVDDQGNPVVDRKWMQDIVGRLWEGASSATWGAVTGILNGVLPESAEIPAAELQRLSSLREDVLRGEASSVDYIQAQFEVVLKAREKAMEPEIEKRVEARLRQEQRTRAQVEQREQSSQQRREEPTPTRGVQGPNGRLWTTQVQIDTAHVKGEITDQEVRELRMNGTYGSLPYR